MANTRKKLREEIEEEEQQEEVEKVKKSRRLIEEDEDDEYENLTTDERVINIEKKVNQIFIIVIISLIVSVISLFFIIVNSTGETKESSDTNSGTANTTTSGYDTSAFKEISATDIASESKKETIVVMIGRQGCGYCAQFAPILTKVAEDYGVTVRYIDLEKMVDITTGQAKDEDAITAISKIGGTGDWATFATDYFGRTPQTMFIKDNKVVYGVMGAADEDVTAAAFEAAGFKK